MRWTSTYNVVWISYTNNILSQELSSQLIEYSFKNILLTIKLNKYEKKKKTPRTVLGKVKSQGAYFQMGENPLFDMT